MSTSLFDRTTILIHLEELNTELIELDASQVELLVVGGSYLALNDLRSGTRDIDTARRLGDDAKRAVALVAERRQLSTRWLNDESKEFLPADFDDARGSLVVEHSHLIVRVPHPDDVFGMKLHASRGEGDLADMIGCGRHARSARRPTWSSDTRRRTRTRSPTRSSRNT